MRVGVTGGAGYIASHVVRDLLEEGHEVVVIDNLSTGNRDNIFTDLPGYRFMEGDIGSDPDLGRFFDYKPEVIFHFAASKAAGESMIDPVKYSANNIRCSLRLLEETVRRECRHFVFSSTAAVYGSPRYLPLDEDHPLKPENYYGFTKKIIEENLEWFSRIGRLSYASLRYFNAAGYDLQGRVRGLEIGPNNLLPVVLEVATGKREIFEIYGADYDTPDGTCIRDYIHVNDLSTAHLLAMDYLRRENRNLIVNLGSESEHSVREVLASVSQVIGREIPNRVIDRRPGDPPRLYSSSRKIKEILGWSADHSDIRTIIESMWRVYSPNGK